MTKPCGIEVERLRYWQGQKFLSRDLRDQVEYEAQLHWWHNRALHNTFGRRYGLVVTEVMRGGALIAVNVGCGLAFDCYGRELILQEAREIELPPAGQRQVPMVLLIRYKETKQFKAKRDLATVCSPARMVETADIYWKPEASVEIDDGAPLSRLIYRPIVGGGTQAVLDAQFMPHVSRPLARPRIESGATIAGDTRWEIWYETIAGFRKATHQLPIGVQVTIDTSAAGFTETPCYAAWLQGELWTRSNVEFFPVPLTHIDKESATGFRFRMWMPMIIALIGSRVRHANFNAIASFSNQQSHGFETEFLNFARQQKLYVCWLGIGEMTQPGCQEPEPCECHTGREG